KFDHPEIGVYYQFEKTKNLHACDCIATTYQSFNKVCAILKDELQDWHVVYDEAHNAVLSADKNYRGKEMNRILSTVNSFKKFTLMSGTWIDFSHPVLDD